MGSENRFKCPVEHVTLIGNRCAATRGLWLSLRLCGSDAGVTVARIREAGEIEESIILPRFQELSDSCHKFVFLWMLFPHEASSPYFFFSSILEFLEV